MSMNYPNNHDAPDEGAIPEAVTVWMEMAHSVPLLTEAEEKELGQRIVQGDEAAYKRIVEANLRLVIAMASEESHRGYKPAPTMAKLIQEGNFGLMEAASKFNPALGQPFGSYALPWIHQAMNKAIPDQAKRSE